MKVKDILRNKGSKVFTINENKTIYEAVCELVENNIGALVVTDDQNQVVGIISERDVLRDSYKNFDKMKDRQVKEIMTRKLIIGALEDDLEYVEHVMTENRIRHLPIFDGKEMVGIISIGDVVKSQLTDKRVENRYLMDYISGKYPA